MPAEEHVVAASVEQVGDAPLETPVVSAPDAHALVVGGGRQILVEGVPTHSLHEASVALRGNE